MLKEDAEKVYVESQTISLPDAVTDWFQRKKMYIILTVHTLGSRSEPYSSAPRIRQRSLPHLLTSLDLFYRYPRISMSAKHLCWALRRRTLRDTENFLVSLLSFVLKACDGLVQWDREGNGFLRASATSCKRPLQTPCPSSDGGTVGLVIGPTPEAMV